MKANDSLFQLIKSLNKTEKTYFRKFARRFSQGSDNTYLKLFDSLQSKRPNGSYNEEDIKAKFTDEKFIRQLPVAKNYLFGNILKSLTQYYEEDNIDLRLSRLIGSAGVLYKKELFKPCLTVITRAKQLAEKFQKDVKLLEAIHLERLALRVYSSLNLSSEALLKNYDEEIEIVKRLENVSRYRKLFDELIILATAKGPPKTDSDKKAMSDILANPLITDPANAICVQSRIVFHQIKCFANKLLLNADEAFKNGMEVLRLIKSIDGGKDIFNYDYIVAAQNLINPSVNPYHMNISLELLKTLKEEEGRLLRNSPSKIRNFLKLRTLSCEISINMTMGEYEENAKPILELLELSGMNAGNTFRDEEFVTHIVASVHYFAMNDFETSLYYVNLIMNSSSFPLREDMLAACRLFKPVIHFELGNYESLDYYLTSTYGFLKKRNMANKTERIMINLLRKLQDLNDSAAYKATLKKAKKELESVDQADFFGPFDIVSWIDSKLENISFSEASRKNFRKMLENNSE